MTTHGSWFRRSGTVLAAGLAFGFFLSPAADALNRSVVASNGIVVAGHPLAAESGLRVLKEGGNACDAAVAAAATLSIMMTDMMGPLGSGYALIWDNARKDLSAVDFNGVAPQATDSKLFDMEKKRRGILAATVPGSVKGWEEIHKKCGSKPWAELWRDAIDYALGRPLDEDSAFHIRRHVQELGIYDTWVKEFLGSDGQPLPAGALHKRPDVAEAYRAFAAKGADALYKGEIGDKLVAFVGKEKGLITKDDLARYSVKWSAPIKTSYRGHDVYGSPPSASSITWMQILNVAENFDMKALGHNTTDSLRVLVEASKYAYSDAYRHNADPAFVPVPVDKLLSKSYGQELGTKIRDKVFFDKKPVITGGLPQPRWGTATSHMVIVDKAGNAVSMTNTLGTFFGSGVVVGGTGLLLSNGMDWFDIDKNIWTGERPGALAMAPGKRNRWTLAPGMLFKDGKLSMVVGGAGAETTMYGIAQPIINVIDFGMDPQRALDAPRFVYGDIYHYTGGTEVHLEPGIKPEVRDQMKALGYGVPEVGKQRNVARGTTNMVVIDPKTGAYWGGGAPNGRDFVAGY